MVWIYPLHAAPALLTEPKIEDHYFINYEQFHKEKTIFASIKENLESVNFMESYNGWHSTRAEKQISEEALSQYLSQQGSPLAPYSAQILESPYWSTIIGICTTEQNGCTKAPYNNYWGIMCSGKLCRYATIEEGLKAIDSLLTNYESNDRDTIEELNGYYVQPASQNWFNTLIETKTQLEQLTNY